MSSYDNDPPEHTGSGRGGALADPKGKPTVRVKARAINLEEIADPTPAFVDVEAKPNTHPKHAIERPRLEYEAAQQETLDSRAELTAANYALVEAEAAETEALQHWLSIQPKVDADHLLREFGQRAAEQRKANVEAGLPPEGVRPVTHNKSGVDTAAAQRSRQSAQMPSTPLRSPVARRVV